MRAVLALCARSRAAFAASSLARFAAQVEKQIGITVSIGLAANKFLAKIASDLDKPRGFAVLGARFRAHRVSGAQRLIAATAVIVLLVAGGVAANSALRARLADLAAAEKIALHTPPLSLCTDNAAMIAWAGAERYAAGMTDDLTIPARPRWPLDPTAEKARGAGVKA